MSVENLAMWSERYRASVTDPETPDLDQAILAAAAKHSASRRVRRRTRQIALASAFGLAALAVIWFSRPPIPDAPVSVTNFGLLEGASRPFLLDARRTVYTAPGLREGLP
jgi:ferric-dicitrate binding protein FerR (iron transport regulator)